MSLVKRAYNRYRTGGPAAIGQAVNRRLRLAYEWLVDPLGWTRLGGVSMRLAQARPLQGPPVVILSLPRSGSSWVGAVLGQAPNAAYLREPLTQAHLATGHGQPVLPIKGRAVNRTYRAAAHLAFAGVPRFPPGRFIVADREQWAYSQRSRRRLVVKEVNPYFAEWLAHTYQPRIVLLVRHPAAVALSYNQLGWLTGGHSWRRLGAGFSRAYQTAWTSLQDYPAVRRVTYDELCESPHQVFEELYAFAGLNWTEAIAKRLTEQTTRDDGTLRGVSRVSQSKVRGWIGKVAPDDLAELMAGYLSHPTPWFQSEADW